VLTLAAAAAVAAGAQAASLPAELTGAQDDPAISRFSGAVLFLAKHLDYEEFTWVSGASRPHDAQTPPPSRLVSGQVDWRVYAVAENKSATEIMANYSAALARAGFKVEFSCKGLSIASPPGECGTFFRTVTVSPYRKMFSSPYLSGRDVGSDSTDFRYLAAVREAPSGNLYVSLTVDGTGSPHLVLQTTVHEGPATSGEVQVDANAIVDSLASGGRIALYGIHFDTASAVMKPESSATVAQMAQALQRQPQLKVYVVGHTDNEGQLQTNMSLSLRRARAVTAALVDQYHIGTERLSAQGVGSLSPLATNSTPEGRALNRRVEMVSQ
jgi:outer membrane protein OmpA-like peptidoglycan-associated protein